MSLAGYNERSGGYHGTWFHPMQGGMKLQRGGKLQEQVYSDLGALKALNTRWLLNTFRICGKTLARTVSSHLGSGLTDLVLTDQQVAAQLAPTSLARHPSTRPSRPPP